MMHHSLFSLTFRHTSDPFEPSDVSHLKREMYCFFLSEEVSRRVGFSESSSKLKNYETWRQNTAAQLMDISWSFSRRLANGFIRDAYSLSDSYTSAQSQRLAEQWRDAFIERNNGKSVGISPLIILQGMAYQAFSENTEQTITDVLIPQWVALQEKENLEQTLSQSQTLHTDKTPRL